MKGIGGKEKHCVLWTRLSHWGEQKARMIYRVKRNKTDKLCQNQCLCFVPKYEQWWLSSCNVLQNNSPVQAINTWDENQSRSKESNSKPSALSGTPQSPARRLLLPLIANLYSCNSLKMCFKHEGNHWRQNLSIYIQTFDLAVNLMFGSIPSCNLNILNKN